MMEEKILKELKESNKTLSSIRSFVIAEAQLIKTLCLESQKQGRDIKKIKLIMEEKWQQVLEQNPLEQSKQRPQ